VLGSPAKAVPDHAEAGTQGSAGNEVPCTHIRPGGGAQGVVAHVAGRTAQGLVRVSRLAGQGSGLHTGHTRHVRHGVRQSGNQGSANGPAYGTGGQNLTVLLPAGDVLDDVVEAGLVVGRQQFLHVVRVCVLARYLGVGRHRVEPRVNEVDGLVLLSTN